jgi:hypothetical protein
VTMSVEEWERMRAATPDEVSVAVSGPAVRRYDRCAECKAPMLYHVDGREVPTGMFCGNLDCWQACRSKPVPVDDDRRDDGGEACMMLMGS